MSGLKFELDTPAPVNPKLLSKDDAIIVFNYLLEGKTPNQIKYLTKFPEAKIKLLEKRLSEIKDMIVRILNRQAWLSRPIYGDPDPETGEVECIDEGEICPVPQTLTKLQERSVELISNDYDVSEPLFNTNDISELVSGIYTVIERLVVTSNSTGDATYDWFKERLTSSAE
jgi:hypothetical protein